MISVATALPGQTGTPYLALASHTGGTLTGAPEQENVRTRGLWSPRPPARQPGHGHTRILKSRSTTPDGGIPSQQPATVNHQGYGLSERYIQPTSHAPLPSIVLCASWLYGLPRHVDQLTTLP
jgi:hypothetical protein